MCVSVCAVGTTSNQIRSPLILSNPIQPMNVIRPTRRQFLFVNRIPEVLTFRNKNDDLSNKKGFAVCRKSGSKKTASRLNNDQLRPTLKVELKTVSFKS